MARARNRAVHQANRLAAPDHPRARSPPPCRKPTAHHRTADHCTPSMQQFSLRPLRHHATVDQVEAHRYHRCATHTQPPTGNIPCVAQARQAKRWRPENKSERTVEKVQRGTAARPTCCSSPPGTSSSAATALANVVTSPPAASPAARVYAPSASASRPADASALPRLKAMPGKPEPGAVRSTPRRPACDHDHRMSS